MPNKRVFISADHGLAITYFFQSDVIPTLLEKGIEVVALVDDGLKEKISQTFGQPGLTVEGLRLNQAKAYFQKESNSIQWWLDFFRRAGASKKMNLEAIDSFVHWVEYEAPPRRKALWPVTRLALNLLRRSRPARRLLAPLQARFTPDFYEDLFQRYQPDLVISSTPGWRLDRYILRAAARRGVPTAAIVQGWDNPSSYALPGAKVDRITCWSEIQKQELMVGSDWPAERINIGGIPSYDGYFRREWVMPKDEYYQLHGLDPERKLLSYACSFITYSPNIQNIEALIRLMQSGRLSAPCQLLIRLHPNHFTSTKLWAEEREQIRKLAREIPHVHMVEPLPLGGDMGYYSGEDMPEKSSMMAHSDIFLTVYSTMVVETSVHGTPIISAVIDSPTGWSGRFTLPLTKIGGWPTHSRFRNSGAGQVADNEEDLCRAVNYYLENPDADRESQQAFIRQECTYTDGSAGRRTGEWFASLLNGA